jgi:hypothetical protein
MLRVMSATPAYRGHQSGGRAVVARAVVNLCCGPRGTPVSDSSAVKLAAGMLVRLYGRTRAASRCATP